MKLLKKDVSRDARRTIREWTLQRWAIQYFQVHQTCTLGGKAGHSHNNKDERFICLRGGGTIYTVHVDTGERKKIPFKPGAAITINRRTAHRFDMTAGTLFMCLANQAFDPSDNIDAAPPITAW